MLPKKPLKCYLRNLSRPKFRVAILTLTTIRKATHGTPIKPRTHTRIKQGETHWTPITHSIRQRPLTQPISTHKQDPDNTQISPPTPGIRTNNTPTINAPPKTSPPPTRRPQTRMPIPLKTPNTNLNRITTPRPIPTHTTSPLTHRYTSAYKSNELHQTHNP